MAEPILGPEPAMGQHEHRGVRAVQRMVEYAPSSGSLALWMRHEDRPNAFGAAPVVTDGRGLLYSPTFERLALEEQTGWVAHVVLHVALRHVQRGVALQHRLGDVDMRLFNLCADAIVNSSLAHLLWLRLPPGAPMLETVLAETLDIDESAESALLRWDVESLYRAMDDRAPSGASNHGQRQTRDSGKAHGDDGSGSNGAQGATPAAGADPRPDGPRAARLRELGARSAPDLLAPDGAADAPEAEAEQTREWGERLMRAHAGDGPFSLLRTLGADRPTVRTPWEQVLRVGLARSLSRKPGLSWSRPTRSYIANQGRAGPHRRRPWEPGTTAARAVPRLALVIDVSGSIDDGLFRRFVAEIESLVRRLEAGLVLVVGDCVVQQILQLEPGRARIGDVRFTGGGGTDFTPLLAEADRHDPDLTVVLTDLDGPARHRPRAPVLWAVPVAHAEATPPFGRKLVLW